MSQSTRRKKAARKSKVRSVSARKPARKKAASRKPARRKTRFLIPPDAVRVWRGFRAPTLSQEGFFTRLSTVFVPATVEMQTAIGLDGYIPSIPGGVKDKPATVPDETAILFWDSQQTYQDGFKTLAVRTYTITHGAVYTKESGANFPTLFSGTLASGAPAYLFAQPADWMHGTVEHLIGAPPEGMNLQDFASRVATIMSGIQSRRAATGAIVCVGDSYVVYWQLDAKDETGLDDLRELCSWSLLRTARPTTLPAGLWDEWPGMAIAPGDSFNMQFERRWEKKK
jgi:hypothetical protein